MTKAFAARIPLNQKFMLTIKEASLYFNISEKKAQRACCRTTRGRIFCFQREKVPYHS